uniref:Rhodopsin domain-containing protein n=1 Tax=Pyricularia oryzae (strain P131) TaxID=1143193 RepID=L7JJV4_PYRO1
MIMMGTVIFTSIYFLMTVFQCHPVDAWWEDNPRSEGRCLPPDVVVNVTFFASAVNCLADFTFAFLPVLIVLPLSMSMTRKVLVVILMGMGAVCFYCGGQWEFGDHCACDQDTNLDFATWSTVEVGTGMTATSLACLRPLFQNLRYMWGGGGQGPSSRWWQLRANRRRQRTGRDERNAAQDGAESGPWVWGNNDNSAINSASADSSGVRGRDARGNASGRHGGGESSWFQKLLQISVITTSSIATLTRRGREGQNEGMDNTSLAENGIATSAGIEEDARGVLDEHHEVQTLPRIYQQDSAVQIPAEDSGLYERAERRPSKPRSMSSAPARASTREATSGHLPVMDPRALINVWQSSEVRGFVCVWMLTHDYYGVAGWSAAVGADTHTRAITQWHQKQWLHY